MNIRKVYAPYSQMGEQVGQTPLEGYVEVNQAVYPAVNTGLINENGEWVGLKSTDKEFVIDTEHLAIPNGATVLSPQKADHSYIDMTGYTTLQIALKVSNGGSYTMTAVMGPETDSYANLTSASPANTLKGQGDWYASSDFETLSSATETLTADYWNIYTIINRLKDQKLLQFKITNASGAESSIQFASMRVV
jgi:hypothetical protein